MDRHLFARSVAELERGDIVRVFCIPVDIGAAVVRPVVGETDFPAVGGGYRGEHPAYDRIRRADG